MGETVIILRAARAFQMLKNQSLNFTSKPELFLIISASILVFLAGALLLLIFFGAVVFGVFWKEKINKKFAQLFDELLEL